MQVLMATCGSSHLRPVARVLQDRDALAGLWITTKNTTGVAPDKFRRAWEFHLLMKPFYHLAGAGTTERVHHALFPVWRAWLARQTPPPFDVAYGIPGYGTELFDHADRVGALKLVDATNSHPTSAYGFWQRECDLWCPGAKPGVPRWFFSRSNREFERADLILCPSLFVRESMMYNGIPEAKCFVNPYGVDTASFTPRTRLPDKPRFVCVGAIGLRKGHQYLFRAFAKVRQQLPDAELICAGNYFPDFRLERPRWEGTFTHFENLPHSQLAKILQGATAFVFPSNEEGFARAVIEAMSSGLPIIATHESGATTLVRDGVEGIIVPARNVDQIADAMIKMANDRPLNEQMGLAARARGTHQNTWEDFTERFLQICAKAPKKARAHLR